MLIEDIDKKWHFSSHYNIKYVAFFNPKKNKLYPPAFIPSPSSLCSWMFGYILSGLLLGTGRVIQSNYWETLLSETLYSLLKSFCILILKVYREKL